MVDNAVRYGFRPVRSRTGATAAPVTERAFCISGASFDVNGGAQNVSLRPGDPIVRLTSGAVNLAPGSEGTEGDVLGVVASIEQYFDANTGRMTAQGPGVPSDFAYGTNLERQTIIRYYPAESAVFAIQVDDIVTATTIAAYQLLIGLNCQHILSGASGAAAASPKLDISGAAATATFDWRIIGISTTAGNVDPAGANFELYVTCNRPQLFTGAGTMWLGI